MGQLQQFAADLHVHTALSPCADDSCTPPNIVSSAIERGMSMIAVTDHNSAENVEAMIRCGRTHGLKVIPGMEVTTAEEVHLVCLLKSASDAAELQGAVYAALPAEENTPEVFGSQFVMDENGAVIGQCGRLLMAAANKPLEEVVKLVHGLGGLVIAAHVDRPSFSVIANLGMVPPGAGFDALEISAATCRDDAVAKFPEIAGWPLVTGSDAHFPDQIGTGPTLFLLEKMDVDEMRMAFRCENEREHLIQ
jgi:predicted metal-dependent phosphoesterase TrpH